MREHIDKIKALSFFSSPVSIEPVPAGIVNHAYKVTNKSETFLVKFLPQKDIGQTPRKAIFSLQQQLADKDLAVKPLYYNDVSGIWIERWCSLPVYSADHVDDSDATRHLARCISIIHNTHLACPVLDIVAAWQQYLHKIPEKYANDLRIQAAALTPRMQKLAHQDLVLCHHDLSLGHLTQAPHHIAFDWEYAGLGNRYFDLASTILVNRMPGPIADEFISQYAHFTHADLTIIRNNIAAIEPCVSLTYLLWMMAEPHRQ